MNTFLQTEPELLIQQDSPDLGSRSSAHWIENGILGAVAYADVFDYPLDLAEIQRYQAGSCATLEQIRQLLASSPRLRMHLASTAGFVCLRGRQELAGLRRERSARARKMWPVARCYGRRIGSLPFVRMVAATGSLAANNPAPHSDIDYMIVTAPGRVWLARLMTLGFARWAALQGNVLCPNYIIAENALESRQRDLYTAHEYAQMAPITGLETYIRLRRQNRWTERLLPASGGPPGKAFPAWEPHPWFKRLAEIGLSGKSGGRLENWEMQRKIERLANCAAQQADMGETTFSAGWCKGHFNGHASRSMAAYRQRLVILGLEEAFV